MKYLAVTGFRSLQELDAYLYNYAEILNSGISLQGTMWAVIEINYPEMAPYQSDRLQSGMMGSSVQESKYEAALSILERV